jgi:hypothetical protein
MYTPNLPETLLYSFRQLIHIQYQIMIVCSFSHERDERDSCSLLFYAESTRYAVFLTCIINLSDTILICIPDISAVFLTLNIDLSAVFCHLLCYYLFLPEELQGSTPDLSAAVFLVQVQRTFVIMELCDYGTL